MYSLRPNCSQQKYPFYLSDPISLMECSSRNKHILMKIMYHHKYLVQHCGCRITNQATVLKNKTNQLLVLQARNLVRKEHVVRAREVICGRGNFIAQAENGTAVWINQFLFRAGIFSKHGEAARFLVLCQTE